MTPPEKAKPAWKGVPQRNVREEPTRRAAPLGGRVFFLFPGTSLIPSIGNTPFGSTWEPTLWSVTPFPQELRLVIWLLAHFKMDFSVLSSRLTVAFETPPFSLFRLYLSHTSRLSACNRISPK